MGHIIEWGEVESVSKNGGGKGGVGSDKFLKLSPGNTYRIRPVGNPCTFHAYWMSHPDEPKRFNRAITEDPVNCVIRQKYNIEPKTRYAVNIIDRSDGKLKVMEAPQSVFDVIKTWANASKQDPGAKNGADFEIKVIVPPSGDRKRTEYKTTPVVQTPFSDEEKVMIKEKGLFDLEEIYKAVPQNEIEDKLYGTSKGSAPAAPAVATTATASSPMRRPSNDASELGF